jgi:hypothetical protein
MKDVFKIRYKSGRDVENKNIETHQDLVNNILGSVLLTAGFMGGRGLQ